MSRGVYAFIARQPILDRRQALHGYELLSRSGPGETFFRGDPEQGTSKVIADSLLLPDLRALTGGKQAYINVTRELLVRQAPRLLSPSHTVIEIVEDVPPDDEVLAACGHLRGLGYRLALDDYRAGSLWERHLDQVDIVKVDVLVAGPEERARTARDLRRTRRTLVAEKVETHEIFRECLALDYDLFQGYFFARPTVVAGRDIPAGKLSCLRVLREVHRSRMDLRAVCRVIEQEVALSYKLLRYVNAACFGWRGSVRSIEQAAALLGERELRRWAAVVAVAGMASDKPDELVRMALVRGCLCEGLAPVAGLAPRATDLFLMGLFSVLDALLDRPMPEVLEPIPIEEDVKAALLGAPDRLRDVLEVACAHWAGDWITLARGCERLEIAMDQVPELAHRALLRAETGDPDGEIRAA